MLTAASPPSATSTCDFRVFENVSTFTKFKLALLDDFVIKKEDALAELDCAIFYLDNNLSTFRTAGSPQLLEELKRKGLRHGTQFTVENVGCFVANLCWNKPGESLCRVGEENYLEIFADYACFARYEEEDIRNFRGSNLIFAPKSKYTVFLKKQPHFLPRFKRHDHEGVLSVHGNAAQAALVDDVHRRRYSHRDG